MAKDKTKSAANSGKMSREKGKRGEREVASTFRKAGFEEARRSVQYCGKVDGTADVVGVPGYHIEVKRCENGEGKTRAWYEQAKRDSAQTGDVPVVVYRRNGEEYLVTVTLKDFINLIRRNTNGNE